VTADEHDNESQHLTLETLDFARVARVATQARQMSVSLRRCECELNAPSEAIEAAWSQSAFIGYDTHVVGRTDDTFTSHAAFIAAYHHGQEPSQGEPPADVDPEVFVEAIFELRYTLRGAAEDEDLEHFAFINSTLHAWPYWRELAQSMTVRMGLPPLTVGPFKIPSSADPATEPATES
jgi:hypothetical protein